MRFDFVDLRLIINIAETGNLARAAERSHLSAPAASSRIKNVEEDIGAKLLYRTSQGVTLTPAGDAFVHHARLMLDQMQHLAGDMRDYGQGVRGHLRIWANTTAITEFLPSSLRSFLRDHPEINIDMREMLSGDIVKGVASRMTDIGIVAGNIEPSGLEMLPYRVDQLALVTALDHPLACRASVDFSETLDDDFVSLSTSSAIHGFISESADRLGARLKLRIQVGNFEAACRMIDAGVGIGVIPLSVARRHAETLRIAIVPLTDAWARRSLRICVRRLDALPAFGRELVNHLRQSNA